MLPSARAATRWLPLRKARWQAAPKQFYPPEKSASVLFPEGEKRMAWNTLIVDKKDGIATVTLNRPDRLNALNSALMTELGRALDELEADAAIRRSAAHTSELQSLMRSSY